MKCPLARVNPDSLYGMGSISESNQDLEFFDLGRKIIGRKGNVLYCCSVVNAAVQDEHPKRSDWQ
jgi:hypothetical protein